MAHLFLNCYSRFQEQDDRIKEKEKNIQYRKQYQINYQKKMDLLENDFPLENLKGDARFLPWNTRLKFRNDYELENKQKELENKQKELENQELNLKIRKEQLEKEKKEMLLLEEEQNKKKKLTVNNQATQTITIIKKVKVEKEKAVEEKVEEKVVEKVVEKVEEKVGCPYEIYKDNMERRNEKVRTSVERIEELEKLVL